MYQAWDAAHVMSLVANTAALAGKRAVANEFHPGSGSPSAMFPLAIYDSMIRLMQFRVPSVAYFCHMDQGEFTRYSMASSEEHVARARNQAILWNLYAEVPPRRRSSVACFMPAAFATPQQADEAASQFGTKGKLVWAMGELGADFYLLNDLDRAREYDRIVIFLAYADREAEAKLAAALSGELAGKKIIVLTGVSTLWGPVGRRTSKQIDRSLHELLPAAPTGGNLVARAATLPGGVRTEMRISETVAVRDLPGFTPIKADDGTVVGAHNGQLLCLAGFPETLVAERAARGPVDSAMRRLAHQWLDVQPGRIDVGAIHIVTCDLAADAPGIWCVENSSRVAVGRGLVAYDVLHQQPIGASTYGPAVLRVWPADQPRIIDTDVCEPMEVAEAEDGLSAVLVSPGLLRTSRPRAIAIYWPRGTPEIRLGDRSVAAAAVGEGFFRLDAPAPGACRLQVRMAGSTPAATAPAPAGPDAVLLPKRGLP